jgi:signal transduction histidine kinase
LLFVEDRTLQATMEEELRRLERLGGLAELALGIAHEIRNPLNGLAGFASLVRRTPNSPRVAEWAVRIEEGAKRVEGTVRDLLDFARPERQGESVCLSLISWLRVAAEELQLDIEEDVGALRVYGASRALDQALANLARNSREAGATRARIRLLASSHERITLHFSDDGPGLDASIANRIFDPFVGTKEQGSGLGLAFASRAFVQMNGALRVAAERQSKDLPGACFEIELVAESVRESNC